MVLHVHPFAVHFPIALMVLVLLLDWVRWFADREGLLTAEFWGGTTPILIVALLGAGVAVISGLSAEDMAVKAGIAQELIDQHQLAAFLASGGLAVVTFWRIALRGAFPAKQPYAYLLSLLVVAVIVGYGAYVGGVMVYGSGAILKVVP